MEKVTDREARVFKTVEVVDTINADELSKKIAYINGRIEEITAEIARDKIRYQDEPLQVIAKLEAERAVILKTLNDMELLGCKVTADDKAGKVADAIEAKPIAEEPIKDVGFIKG